MENSANLGTDYDFSGLMHYGAYSFSKNGQPTIRVIDDPDGSRTSSLGSRNGMTDYDVLQVNKLYICEESK